MKASAGVLWQCLTPWDDAPMMLLPHCGHSSNLHHVLPLPSLLPEPDSHLNQPKVQPELPGSMPQQVHIEQPLWLTVSVQAEPPELMPMQGHNVQPTLRHHILEAIE